MSYSNIRAINICRAQDTMTISTSLAFSSTYGDPLSMRLRNSELGQAILYVPMDKLNRYKMIQSHVEDRESSLDLPAETANACI
jgi:hypothetical protein